MSVVSLTFLCYISGRMLFMASHSQRQGHCAVESQKQESLDSVSSVGGDDDADDDDAADGGGLFQEHSCCLELDSADEDASLSEDLNQEQCRLSVGLNDYGFVA